MCTRTWGWRDMPLLLRRDGTVFAHTHPEGSAAMQAMMLANGGSGEMADTGSMGGMDMGGAAEHIPAYC